MITKTYSISTYGPSISLSSMGGVDWESHAIYRYTYHKEAGLWSDWNTFDISDINDKKFKDKKLDIEIEISGLENDEDFPVFSIVLPDDDPECHLPSISVNENGVEDGSDACTATLKVVECEGEDVNFNPYAIGSAAEIYNELSSIVSDTFGLNTRYFRTSPVRNSADYIFHEYSLKNVSAANDLKVLIEDNNLPSRSFTINNPLLDYQESLTVHIVKDEFHNAFGAKSYPREHDYLSFSFKNFNKMYEVIGVYLPDDFLYTSSYWIVLLQPYQERSMIGIDDQDSEVIKDRENAEDTKSATLNIDDGDLTKEIETFTFNQRDADHRKEAILDTEKARGDTLLNDKILDNSRKRSDFIANAYDSETVKCQKEIIYNVNNPVASYNYNVQRKGIGSCAILYYKQKNESICRISFIIKLLSTVTKAIPIISDGDISVWMTRKSVSVKRGDIVRTFTMNDSTMTNKWNVVSIIMDEDDPSMTRASIWIQERDTIHSRDKFSQVIVEGFTSSSIDKYYPLLNDADYGEMCLFGGPFCITNIKVATDPLSPDKELSAALVQISQDMQNMIISDMAIPRINSESILPIVKHADSPAKKPIPQYSLSLRIEPDNGGIAYGDGVYNDGAVVRISALPSTGYVFSSWSDGDINSSRDITISSDITLSAIFAIDEPLDPIEGVLPGIFSVSPEKQIRFSKGNLYYDLNNMKWYLFDTQTKITSDNSISLFGWGCNGVNNGSVSYTPDSTSINDEDYYIGGSADNDISNEYASSDWGHNPILNGGDTEDKWYTLSKDEWLYLYNGRDNASNLRTRGSIEDVNGYMFMPDDWVCPDGVDLLIDTARFSNNKLSQAIWNILEKSGVVFLPAAGDRDGEDIDEINSYGDYWSTTHYNDKYAYCFTFNKGREFVYYANRHSGHSVRLVTGV